MKTFNVLLISLLTATAAFSQTAEEILDKSQKAMGGDAYNDIKSMVTVGEASMPGNIKADLSIYTKEGGKLLVLSKINAPGMTMEIKQGCNGEDCYSEDPTLGKRLLEGQEKEMMMMQNDFQAQANWRRLYSKVEYKGEGDVGGKKVHKVYVETEAGVKMTNAYDAETYILLQSEGTSTMAMGTLNFTNLFEDYKDVGKGILMPMTTKMNMMNMQMVMNFTEVELNAPIPDSKFDLPPGLK